MIGGMRSLRTSVALLLIGVVALISSCGSDGSPSVPSVTVTRPGTSTVPSTEAPTTTGANTSSTDTTGPDTTQASTTTLAPTTTAPVTTLAPATTGAPDVAAPATDDSDDTTWWPWALAGGLALIVLVAVLLARRSPGSPAWVDEVAAALDDSDQLSTHLATSTADGLPLVAGQDASRQAVLVATLDRLAAAAPQPSQRTAVMSVRGAAASLHASVDAATLSSGPPAEADAASVRAQATALHTATAQARAELVPAPTNG
jgi:hypothetical protein